MGYTLMDIVSEFIAENGKAENQRARLYTIALSGLRELNTDVNGITKIVELTINANDTVDLPNDFLNYSKIGILGRDGRIHSLNRDNSIGMNQSHNACGEEVSVQPNNGGDPFYGMPYSGAFYGLGQGAQFGVGGGNSGIGYYRLSKSSNQLYLSNMNILAGTSLILEYVADVESDGVDFSVNAFIIETIKMYISWRYVMGDRNTSLGEKQTRERLYYNALRISKARYGSSTPEEWAAALRSTSQATVRF